MVYFTIEIFPNFSIQIHINLSQSIVFEKIVIILIKDYVRFSFVKYDSFDISTFMIPSKNDNKIHISIYINIHLFNKKALQGSEANQNQD